MFLFISTHLSIKHHIFRTLLTSENCRYQTRKRNFMKFYLFIPRYLIIQLVKYQINIWNLNTTFWHCKNYSDYFWTRVYLKYTVFEIYVYTVLNNRIWNIYPWLVILDPPLVPAFTTLSQLPNTSFGYLLYITFLFHPGWRLQIETFSAPLGICAENSPVTGEFGSWTLMINMSFSEGRTKTRKNLHNFSTSRKV